MVMSGWIPWSRSCSGVRPLRPTEINRPECFSVEVAVEDLAAPRMIAFQEQDRMLIAESAYGSGGEPRVIRIEPNGKRPWLHKAVFLELSCLSRQSLLMMDKYLRFMQEQFR